MRKLDVTSREDGTLDAMISSHRAGGLTEDEGSAGEHISVVTRSPGLDAHAVEIVVTLPTYKRPEHLVRTLQSLERQRTRRTYAVVVMENDAEARQGATQVQASFERGDIDGMLIIAHERGNCCVYNSGWLTALAHFPAFEYLLVIDDDEIAGPDWIECMCDTADKLGADIVGAEVMPVFADPAHQGWADHPIFSSTYKVTGPVPELYSTGNLLIRRKVLERMGPPFLDLQFNFMGGGDSDFLSRARDSGFRLAWCADAPVRETVPARRLQRDWIRTRAIRNGVISTLLERRRRAGEEFGRIKTFAHSLSILAYSPVRGLREFVRTGSVSIGIYPVHVGIGRVLGEFGYTNEQYRHAENN